MPFCQEEAQFIVSPKEKNKSGGQYWNFQETPFEEKRVLYVENLRKAKEKFLNLLFVPLTAYLTSEDTALQAEYQKVKDLINFIQNNPPEELFFKESNEIEKATFNGADEVYDFFIRQIEHSAKMDFFGEFYGKMPSAFEKASKITTDIFTKYNTRGFICGCLDTIVQNFINYLNNNCDSLQDDNWRDRLTNAASIADGYNDYWNNFRNNTLNEANNIRKYFNPIVQFLNACKILTTCASTPMTIRNLRWYPDEAKTFQPILTNAIRNYGFKTYNYQDDFYVATNGASIQISDNMFNHVSSDGTDADMFESNATKIAMNEVNFNSIIEEAFNNMIDVP